MKTNIPIYSSAGQEVGTYELDTEALATKVNKQLLHDAIVMYRSNLRQGSAKTKTRAEVKGCKKKMYRQKGTGNARAGHKRSGVRRGGGHIFAKSPRNWYYRMPKKSLRIATRMAVLAKIQSAQLTIIDQLKMEEPKTKAMTGILKSLGLNQPKTKIVEGVAKPLDVNETLLIAIEQHDVNTYKSARNIEGVRIMPVAEINAYEVTRPKRLLITKAALDAFVTGQNPTEPQSSDCETVSATSAI